MMENNENSENVGNCQAVQRRKWSPYLAGAAIGALETVSMLTAKRPIGITTAFENTAALLANSVAPRAIGTNEYLQATEKKPQLGWEEALVLGVALGSFLAARQEKSLPLRPRPPSVSNANSTRNLLGGALMMFGARMAKGCTSGHGISGTMQFSASSWLFNGIIFATGAVVSKLLEGQDNGA